MRYFQIRFADFKIAEEQDVQIERSRSVLDSGGAIPAKLLLQRHQPDEQFPRVQRCLQFYHGIDEARLIGKSDRLGGVKRRAARHPAQGVQA